MSRATDPELLVRVVAASHFAPTFLFSGVAVALPSMGAGLEAGATVLGLVETLFLAGALAAFLPAGRLADAGDKRALYRLGILGFGLTSLAIGLSSSMGAILFLRLLQGACSAIFATAGPAILAETVPPERRGRAYGSVLAATYSGLTLGPMVAGVLVEACGWRAVFLAGALVLIAGWLLVRGLLPSRWRSPGRAVHLPSATLALLAVLSLIAGSAAVGRGALGAVGLAAGLALAGAFVAWQRRLPRPLLDVRALRGNPVLGRALVVQSLLYTNAFCSVFLLSLYLQVSLDRSPPAAGVALALSTLVMAVVAPFAGSLADRASPRRVAALGVAFVLATTLLATALGAGSSLAHVGVVLALQGLGYGFFSSPNMALVMNSVPASGTGMASALSALSRSIGMVAGMLLTTLLLALELGDEPVQQHPLELVGVLRTAFATLAACTALALGLALRRDPAPLEPAGGA